MLVVKIGGGAGIAYEALAGDIGRLVAEGKPVILVHGASDATNELAGALGRPLRLVTSVSGYQTRYTDREMLDIFIMASRALNTRLTAQLQRVGGVAAVGVSGVDGAMASARRKDVLKIVEQGRRRILRGDHSGKLTWINANLLDGLIRLGFTPVVAPIALSEQGEPLNVDADRLAAAIANEMAAETVVYLTHAPGLLRDPEEPDSLIRRVAIEHLPRARSFAQGRMRIKLLAVEEALSGAVTAVTIGDARRSHPLLDALSGRGTVFSRGGVA